ncbi:MULTISPECIES: DUF551 domain-containing protein [unclassified Enterobacter]|uniref:DUF551 domain-containing protein n=1 Tax=unclassified Enterobacter TaxID=2608935 RepID=UPI0015F65AD3|nr:MULTISPECIES: DUF551 domain-containing protein [unclassified Enterobacter]MBA7773653.1 DUF551 domain-containing protein [Enterobacter sp. RHBSTW-00974]MBA7778816.1 DUF551 domain-containing protein [Enterobacter sp. RHBSTW-00318]MBA7831419.1 DUF551 domain-containing protein [Enterobacter sp. RHBSTW-00340]
MTFTKEQLQHIIETDHVQCGDASALARMALAGMEAEPVAWAHRLINKRNGVVHPWVYGSAEACPSEGDIFNIEVMPLYTAPPAPVSVPAAMEMDDDFDSAFEHGKAVGWNAYRAAMLQSFGNSEQLNSPVIPDGWVACSEQMPEENAEQEVLACFKGGDISTLYYFEGRWDDAYGIVPIRQDVTHWMPLPSAPQQEA